ncbi:protein kinase [Stemphylium lycopersici]|nr:protein kinase [Stemphylium lycopersici]
MAPQTPKTKKQPQHASTPAAADDMDPATPTGEARPPLVAQPSETYEKAQEDEREVLKAVFMDDYEESEARGAWSKTTDRVLRLKLTSFSNEKIFVTLCAKLTATYPKSLPTLTLEDCSSLRKSTWDKLYGLLKSRPQELVGEVMMYDIATAIQEILEDEIAVRETDGTYENLDAERAMQEAAAAEQLRLQEEEQQKKLDEERAQEQRLLQQMVGDEMRRKDQMAKRKKNRASAMTPPPEFPGGDSINYIPFDRTIFIQHEETTIQCTAVENPLPFRSGPLTEELLVKPVGTSTALTLVLKRARVEAGDAAADSELKKAIMEFEDEMEEVKRLRQAAIMTVLDFKVEHLPDFGWDISVLMEHADRGSLGERLTDDGPLQVARVRSWTIELLEALDYYHRNGIVHKRLHPHNILLKRSLGGGITVHLADASYQDSLYRLQSFCKEIIPAKSTRSFYWIAPELSQSLQHTRKTDVWDLGVVFLQMLFGIDAPEKYNSPKDLSDILGCSEPLQEVLRKFFKPDPKKRHSAFDLIPSEFLRDEVDVYERPAEPTRSRNSSTSLGRYRLRRESSSAMVPTYSRYANDWVEQGRLGKGGYGEVVKARNKVDGRLYAIKKIKQKSASALDEVLSEVMLLSRLNHSCVVRYYTAWPEAEADDDDDDDESGSSDGDESDWGSDVSPGTTTDGGGYSKSAAGLDFISSSGYPKIEFGSDAESEDDVGAVIFGSDSEDGSGSASIGHISPAIKRRAMSDSNAAKSRSILYIQMEFCEKQTLRDLIRNGLYDEPEEYWKLFRQILEGLSHIHGHGIIHRDLKPDNVFIDLAKIPKIGDFGLATSGQYQRPDTKSSNDNQDGGDMTRSVGTALYVAPELSSSVTGDYNNKVDMYSMGIIFFEMCFPLRTAMERDKVIRSLRERKHDLPLEFETPEKALQGDIIKSLISHRPSERPGCIELLRSGKVPAQMEDEAVKEALKALSDRNSPHYAKMMAALFSQKPDTQARDHAWDLSAAAQPLKSNEVLLQNLVKDRLAMIFRSHGAVEIQRQALLPWSDHYADTHAVKLFDPSGTLVQLPYDLTLPYARSIGRGGAFLEKTFTISHVYRENYIGSAPRSNGEADFDILSYDAIDLALKESEVLKVVDEIIDEFPSFRSTPMCFHLNHADLLDMIMEFCRIPAPKRTAVKAVLSQLNIRKSNWASIRNQLRSSDIGIASTSLDDLARFDWRDTPEKAFAKLRRLFEGSKYVERTETIFSHLSSVVNYMKLWNVKRKVYISVLSSFNERFYSGGILFQCLFDTKQREVLAAGGRYDKLIEEYRPKASAHAHPARAYHAVGVNLGWDRLVNSMARYIKKPEKSTFLRKHAEEDTPSISWMPRRCDCLVASFDPSVLRSTGIRMVADLISHGYTAELAIDAHSIEDILRHYRDDRHSWVIVIKHGVAPDKPELKVKSIAKKEDTDMRSADLFNYLRNELRDREEREGTAARLIKAAPPAPSQTPNTAKANVDVLIAQHRSKKSNKWSIVEAAQSRSADLLSAFQSAPIAAIESKEEVMNLIKETRLSDPESWRYFIQKMPLAERNDMPPATQLRLRPERRVNYSDTRRRAGAGGNPIVLGETSGPRDNVRAPSGQSSKPAEPSRENTARGKSGGSKVFRVQTGAVVKPKAAAKRQTKKKSVKQECLVCVETKTKDQCFKAPEDACEHFQSICTVCITKMLRAKMTEQQLTEAELSCPFGNCDHILDYAALRASVTKATFTSYDEAVTKHALSTGELYVAYLSSECGLHFSIEDCTKGKHRKKLIECPYCENKTCLKCDRPWSTHGRGGCDKVKMAENKASEAAVKQLGAKPCPECGVNIQKNGGCDHMTLLLPTPLPAAIFGPKREDDAARANALEDAIVIASAWTLFPNTAAHFPRLTNKQQENYDSHPNMSEEGSDEWVSDSGDSGAAEEPVADEEQALGSFPRRSLEEVERDAATARRRTSSLSSSLAALSSSEHAALQPAQPAPTTPPHGSAFPGQYPHDALHDRTRSPKTTLPDYHDPDSPTQKRGPGIARNPVSDTWRADAYEKREAGKGKIVDVAKRQDRWKCEYCGNLNERGVSGFVAAPGDEEGVGVAGSSRVSPNTTRTPIQIPAPTPAGLAPGEQVKCTYCAEQIFAEHPRYDPREMSEDGMHWDEVDAPEEVKAKMKKTVGRVAKKRVLERWKEDEKRREEEEEERSKRKGKGKEIKRDEDED